MGNELLNLKGQIKVNKKNEAMFKANQKKFQNYYEMIGVPITPPEEFQRITRKHLIKKQVVPEKLKIMTKDYRPGYASYMERAKQGSYSPNRDTPNYEEMIQELEKAHLEKQQFNPEAQFVNPINNLPVKDLSQMNRGDFVPQLSRPGHIEKEFSLVQHQFAP